MVFVTGQEDLKRNPFHENGKWGIDSHITSWSIMLENRKGTKQYENIQLYRW